jgi:subtilase family serine protease
VLAACVAAVAAAGFCLPASPAAGAGRAQPTGRAASDPVRIFPAATVIRSGSGPLVGLDPAQVRSAYDVDPLLRQGIDGAGQTIVIVDSFGSPTITTDLARFDHAFHLPAPPSFRVIQPTGPVPAYRPNSNRVGWASETTLDVEWSHSMAPGASIVLVETPTSENEGTSGFPKIVAAEKYVIRHHLGDVISQSFGATEQTFPSAAVLRRFRGAYLLAAQSRYSVTVLGASGDTGSGGDTDNMHTLFPFRAVEWPATDPLVTAVGGTQLDPTNGQRSVAWSDSGGGRSVVFSRPAYQDSVRYLVHNRRGIPDIAMDASCSSGVAIYSSYPGSGPGHWSGICGTSLATPLFAGVVALADQVAGHPLGLINPAIYQLAAERAPGIVPVRSGDNRATYTAHGSQHAIAGFHARRGYSLVDGVGTVNAAAFVPELARLAGGPSAVVTPALPAPPGSGYSQPLAVWLGQDAR